EWKNYRWGPVSGREAVPTLVDSNGYFFQSAEALYNNREVAERLASEFGFGMSEYFGEAMDAPQYWAAPRQKAESLVAMLDRLKPGVNVVVTHVGIDDAELGALLDMNTDQPLPEMSKNRQG